MILGILTLMVAIAISAVSAYYSILGLTAIFAGTFWPIVIMGSALEIGKLTTVVWLHYNWERATYKIKSYLVVATVLLAFITSMGVFGALSKFHLDQNVPAGDVVAQVALFDEKIQTQRDNIVSAKLAITQLNASVDQLMGRTTDAAGATKAAQLRRAQRKERAALAKDIDQSQAEIAKLQEARAPIASTMRKVEADVGPIKYIAAIIYGDNTGQTTLENAVRWVIIIIVFVFDPLAIVLLLAATTSIDWSKLEKLREKKEQTVAEDEESNQFIHEAECNCEELRQEFSLITDKMAIADQNSALLTNKLLLLQKEVDQANQLLAEANTAISQQTIELSRAQTISDIPENLDNLISKDQFDAIAKELSDATATIATILAEKEEATRKIEKTSEIMEMLADDNTELSNNYEQLKTDLADEKTASANIRVQLESANKELTTVTNLLEQVRSESTEASIGLIEERENLNSQISKLIIDLADTQEIEKQSAHKIDELTQHLISLSVELEDAKLKISELTTALPSDISHSVPSNASFGISFPLTPAKGDLFLRVDFLPSKLFKWSGNKWIELDKSVTDVYTGNEKYISLLVQKLSTGEYELDDLTAAEQTEVAAYLEKAKNDPTV